MFRRLCLGLFEGLLIGAASGLACSRGLGWATLGAFFAVAFISALSVFSHLKLAPDAGSEVSGRGVAKVGEGA